MAVAGELRPEAVLLGIGLSGMGCDEIARPQRERPEFRRTLIVVLTGWGQEDDRRRSSEVGIDIHLIKPVDPAALRGLIASEAR